MFGASFTSAQSGVSVGLEEGKGVMAQTQITIRQGYNEWLMDLQLNLAFQVRLSDLVKGQALAEEFKRDIQDLEAKWKEVSI